MTTTNILALSDSYCKCSTLCFYVKSAQTYTESYSRSKETGQEQRQTLIVSRAGQSGERKMMQEYSKRP